MAYYLLRDDAICIADYVVDEHPYDKDSTRPETYSDYNQGWNDACDYIRGKLEAAKPAADVEPVRRVTPIRCGMDEYYGEWVQCPNCDFDLNTSAAKFCGGCGAKMDLGGETNDD